MFICTFTPRQRHHLTTRSLESVTAAFVFITSALINMILGTIGWCLCSHHMLSACWCMCRSKVNTANKNETVALGLNVLNLVAMLLTWMVDAESSAHLTDWLCSKLCHFWTRPCMILPLSCTDLSSVWVRVFVSLHVENVTPLLLHLETQKRNENGFELGWIV